MAMRSDSVCVLILVQGPKPGRVPAPQLAAEGSHFPQKQWVSAELEVGQRGEEKGEAVK